MRMAALMGWLVVCYENFTQKWGRGHVNKT